MRYAFAALAVVGAVMAHGHDEEVASTVFSTKFFTITSCAPEVTNCPARSTVISSSVIPLITSTSVAAAKPTAPAAHPPVAGGNNTIPAVPKPVTETGAKPVPVPASTGAAVPVVSKPASLVTSAAAASTCGGISVKTISTSVTTVVPTVIYETVQLPCPTPSKPSATIPGVPTGGNGTVVPPPTAPVTAGAAGLTGSALFAAVAGVAAVVFA